jgi:hypothetical protein
LVRDFFQRTSILKRASIAAIRFHGRNFPEVRFQGTMDYIGEHVGRECEIIYGMASEVTDNKMFVVLLVTAPVIATEEEEKEDSALELEARGSVGSRQPAEPNESTLVRLQFSNNKGEPVDVHVARKLYQSYHAAIRNQGITVGELERIFDEIQTATGERPETPERFRSTEIPFSPEQPRASIFNTRRKLS